MTAPKPPPPRTGFWYYYAIENWNKDIGFDDCYFTAMRTPKGMSLKNRSGKYSKEGMGVAEPELILMEINTLSTAKKNELVRTAKFLGYLHSRMVLAKFQLRDIRPADFLAATTEGLLFEEIDRLGLMGELNRYVKSPMMTFQEINLDQPKQPVGKKAVTASIGHPMPVKLPPPATLKSQLSIPKLETIHDVREYVNKAFDKAREVVIGQDAAIKLLLIRFVSYIRNADLASPILVCGPTGCGKTYLLRVLSEITGLPFARIVVPDLTPAGIKGMNIQDALASEILAIKSRYGGDPPRLVLQIDEFDKIVRKGDDDLGFSAMAQNEFLKLLEPGAAIVVNGKQSEAGTVPLNALITLSGAFSFIEYDHASGVDEHVLKEAGFIDELNGRIGATIPLRKLEKEDFLRMLSQDKPVPQIAQQVKELSSLGIDVKLHDETVDLIAQMAVDSGMGARHISKTVREAFDRLTERILFADIRSDAKENRGLELEEDPLSKRMKVTIKPQFIPKKPKKEKRKVGFDRSES